MAQRITHRAIMSNLAATFPNDLVTPPTASVEVPNYAQLIDVRYDNNRIMGFFAFDAETPPDDTVQRTFLVVPGNGNVPDGNYQHCATVKLEAQSGMLLHVFELVQS